MPQVVRQRHVNRRVMEDQIALLASQETAIFGLPRGAAAGLAVLRNPTNSLRPFFRYWVIAQFDRGVEPYPTIRATYRRPALLQYASSVRAHESAYDHPVLAEFRLTVAMTRLAFAELIADDQAGWVLPPVEPAAESRGHGPGGREVNPVEPGRGGRMRSTRCRRGARDLRQRGAGDLAGGIRRHERSARLSYLGHDEVPVAGTTDDGQESPNVRGMPGRLPRRGGLDPPADVRAPVASATTSPERWPTRSTSRGSPCGADCRLAARTSGSRSTPIPINFTNHNCPANALGI